MKADLREHLGKVVRHAWIAWAHTQDNPKASWLIEWEALPEADKEADRQIAEATVKAFLALALSPLTQVTIPLLQAVYDEVPALPPLAHDFAATCEAIQQMQRDIQSIKERIEEKNT